MRKIFTSFFSLLLATTCSVYAQEPVQDSVPEFVADTIVQPEESAAVVPVADSSAILPEESSAAVPMETYIETSSSEPSVDTTMAAAVDSTRVPQPAAKKLDNEQVKKILAPRQSQYPRYYPGGLNLRSSYAPSNGVDLGVGFLFPLSESWPVSIGFEPFHLQMGAEDFQVVSDETLWIAGAGAILGGLGPLFVGKFGNTQQDSSSVKKNPEPMSLPVMILAAVALVPVYAICGYLYIPVVPGSWLGITDRSRLNTQLISEGFHKRSFTYMNDIGLRLSPIASSDEVLRGYVEGGIRFEKNFDRDMEYRYFAQVGISLSP